MDEVNEGSNSIVTIGFTDPNGNAVTPSNVDYTIKDFFTDKVLVKELGIEPAAGSIEITLNEDAVKIVNELYGYEVRIITTTYTYNSDQKKTDEYWYKVINMSGIPIPADEVDVP